MIGLHRARSSALDAIGEMWGVRRGRRWLVRRESDESMRERMRLAARMVFDLRSTSEQLRQMVLLAVPEARAVEVAEGVGWLRITVVLRRWRWVFLGLAHRSARRRAEVAIVPVIAAGVALRTLAR